MSERFYFFFSSRRRHTRYIGDWSSDVCSSDLNIIGEGPPAKASAARENGVCPHFKTRVREAQAFFQGDSRAPAERAQLRGVEELLRGAVGLRAVVDDIGVALDDALDDFGQLADRLVLAVADVEERGLLRAEGGGELLLGQV